MSKINTLHWAAYTRNQEAVATAIVRKEYTDMTSTGVGVVDEFFALMDQVGILNRLAVEGVYQRRMIPMALMMTTYCAKIIQGLSSQNQTDLPELGIIFLSVKTGKTASRSRSHFTDYMKLI